MKFTRVTATKNLMVNRYEAEQRIDAVSAAIRTRFAGRDKHQIYADKREEADRYLKASAGNKVPDPADYPYLSAEVGITAVTMTDLANLWISMDRSWKRVAASIERISLGAKSQVRVAAGPPQIEAIVGQAITSLEAIGTPSPERPATDNGKKPRHLRKPATGFFPSEDAHSEDAPSESDSE